MDADHHLRWGAPCQRDVLLRRSRAGRHAGRSREPGLAAGDHTAQPRARDARPRGQARRDLRPSVDLGVGGTRGRRHANRRAAGCAQRTCRDQGHSADKRVAQLAGRCRRNGRDSRRFGHQGVLFRGDTAAGAAARRCRRPARRPGRRADRGAHAMARPTAQAQPRADLRRRRERSSARTDRYRRPAAAEGPALTGEGRVGRRVDWKEAGTVSADQRTGTDERIRSEAERIIALGEGSPRFARDPVNLPMIENWVEAIGDDNCVYTDPEFAAASVHGALVAPPAMAQVWTMAGQRAGRDDSDPMSQIVAVLEDAGYASVVATNADYAFRRYLRLG